MGVGALLYLQFTMYNLYVKCIRVKLINHNKFICGFVSFLLHRSFCEFVLTKGVKISVPKYRMF